MKKKVKKKNVTQLEEKIKNGDRKKILENKVDEEWSCSCIRVQSSDHGQDGVGELCFVLKQFCHDGVHELCSVLII